jgi:acyl dehydratase
MSLPPKLPTGRTFDEFEVGDTVRTGGRTLTDADLVLFAGLSGDHNPAHIDEVAASAGPLRGRVAHGMLVQSIATGLAVQTGVFHGTLIALAGMEIQWKTPARVGDTISCQLTVAEMDPEPRPRRGRMWLEVEVQREDGTVLAVSRWETLVSRRPAKG